MVEHRLGARRSMVRIHEGDVLDEAWDGGPIELLFVDIAKTWDIWRHLRPAFVGHVAVGGVPSIRYWLTASSTQSDCPSAPSPAPCQFVNAADGNWAAMATVPDAGVTGSFAVLITITGGIPGADVTGACCGSGHVEHRIRRCANSPPNSG